MIFLLLFAAVFIGFPIAALWSAISIPEPAWRRAEQPKTLAVVAIFLTGIFGATYYWLAIRPKVRDAASVLPDRRKTDPWSGNDTW